MSLRPEGQKVQGFFCPSDPGAGTAESPADRGQLDPGRGSHSPLKDMALGHAGQGGPKEAWWHCPSVSTLLERDPPWRPPCLVSVHGQWPGCHQSCVVLGAQVPVATRMALPVDPARGQLTMVSHGGLELGPHPGPTGCGHRAAVPGDQSRTEMRPVDRATRRRSLVLVFTFCGVGERLSVLFPPEACEPPTGAGFLTR